MVSTSKSPMFTIADAMPEITTRKFTLFSLLPPELRLKIWGFAFIRPRIIKTSIYSLVDPYQTVNEITHVNREARYAAWDYYRVIIPCWYVTGIPFAQVITPQPLFFNPEHDFLEIENKSSAIDDTLAFIYHLKTLHDPDGFGLLNLAVKHMTLRQIRDFNPLSVRPLVRNTLTEFLSQLREVFFITSELRLYQSWNPNRTPEGPESWCPEVPGDRSYLKMALRDKVGFTQGNTAMVETWVEILQKFFPSPQHIAVRKQMRVLLRRAKFTDYCDRKVIERWANEELELSGAVERPNHAPGVKPVLGFWLFPLRFFFYPEDSEWEDIRPELGLIDLP
ncbi:hypothetical protein F5B19DRAFT_490832 [Rostrohypoxylon terebratum]|nr:hypothetical protein F5B19DRAFT_490832 [Rostrohypoxylon terebratum]